MKIPKQLTSKNNKKELVIKDVDDDNKKNEHIEKEDMINKILKYQGNRRFASTIKEELGFKYTRAQLNKYTKENVETILHRIRTHLNTRNMDQVFNHMAKVTAKGYEDVVTGFGYNIEGFQEILFENPAFHDAFERYKIEKKVPEIPPSFQLLYIIASTTYIAHISNKKYIETKEIKKEPPKNKIQPKQIQKKEIQKKDDIEDRLKSNYKPGDIII